MVDFSERWAGVSAGIASGDFDPVGANNSYAFDAPFPALPALPSTFAPSSTSRGAVVTSSGGAPATGGGVASAGAAVAGPSNASAGTATASAGAGTSGSIADYFLRAVIIILGFIFVAVGLNMFRPGLVPNPVKALHR